MSVTDLSDAALHNPQTMPDATPPLCFGYTCHCGEKVVVLKLQAGKAISLPLKLVATCSKGHVATVNAEQFGLLEHWDDSS